MFEWDEAKNAANVKKHGIGFAKAVEIFQGFVLTELDDRFDYDEAREFSLGLLRGVVVLAVVHTDRNGMTRIISARQATAAEARRYHETALYSRTHS